MAWKSLLFSGDPDLDFLSLFPPAQRFFAAFEVKVDMAAPDGASPVFDAAIAVAGNLHDKAQALPPDR